MKALETKAKAAAAKYLEQTDRDIIDTSFLDRFLVFEDDGELVFADVFCTTADLSTEFPKVERSVFEKAIYEYFSENPDIQDMAIRYDTIEVFVINTSRALIRHHIKAGFSD